ncbi:MAG: carboxylate--amine ligase, partial [Spirochaetota bacterium]
MMKAELEKPAQTILILGGGSCQLEAIYRVRRMGFRTAVASNDPACPGRRAADIFLEVSTFDIEGIHRAAGDIRADGILVVGTDQPVAVAAEVSEKRGLPSFLSAEAALNVTNKRRMKSLLTDRNIPMNPYRICTLDVLETAAKDLRPPFVVKPLDSQGQRGVYLAGTVKEAADRARETLSFSREMTLCMEEYYPSGEITVSCWSREGELFLLSATDRLSFFHPPYIGICNAHIFPSRFLPDLTEEIYDLCCKS